MADGRAFWLILVGVGAVILILRPYAIRLYYGIFGGLLRRVWRLSEERAMSFVAVAVTWTGLSFVVLGLIALIMGADPARGAEVADFGCYPLTRPLDPRKRLPRGR